ncbi:MAG: M50 family metallopeptidase [Desulfitobacteriaceae bacterium]|nr:M50 family metallopeptidase [Desulfitobacteriaceae bacterium]
MFIAVSLLEVLLFMLLVWLCVFLVVLVHEMGHALMYRIFFRDKDWNITIGTGRTIIKLKRFTLRVIPIRGFFGCEPKYKGSKLQYIMMYLGGPLSNVFFIVLLILLSKSIKANEQPNLVWFLGFTFWANVSQFFLTVIPMKYWYWPYKGHISDGMRILEKAKETKKS